MNAIYHSRRGVAWTRSALRSVASWRGPRSRTQVIVAAAAATVLAVGVGIVWGIAGATDQRADTAGEPFGDPQSLPGGTSGGTLDGLASPGAVTEGGDLPGGSGSGAGSGTGPGGAGDPAGNRPPVIDNPGLSSDGFTLTIAPTVNDPDGDAVTVGYSVDGGQELSVTDEPTYRFTVDGVGGYRHEAGVTIVATDAQGATTRGTFTHDLVAVTTVTVREVTFRLQAPALCFEARAAWRLTADLRLRGAATATVEANEELRVDRSSVVLLDRTSGEVSGAAPSQQIFISNAELAGERDSGNFSHDETASKLHRLFVSAPCRGYLSYKVTFGVR